MRAVKAGSTDISVVIRIIDSTDGTPETGVVWNTAGIDLQYRREGAVSTAITEATLAGLDSAHSDGGFLHIGNGYYRLDLPDAAVAAGVTGVLIHGTVTGMVVIGEYIQLVTYNPFDSVRLGLTALPNAAADAAGGLPISDVGGLDLDAKLANTNEVTAARMGALTDWINGGRLDLILDIVAADVVNLDGAAMRGTDSAALASVCTEARLAELDTANLPTDVANVKTDTAAILIDTAVIGAAGAGLTAIPWNAAWDAEVQSECADALTAYSASTLTAAQVNSEVDTALADVNLDHLVGTATGIPAVPAGTFLDQIMDDGTAVFDRTTDSLQAVRDRGDAAWITATGFALATVCTEARLAELDAANLPTDVANVKIDTAAILVDTGADGVVVASGSKTGYSLAAAGLDNIVIETSLNARQALSIVAAGIAGVLAGAATTTVIIAAAGVPATNRITATVDADGNRSAVTLSVPA